MVGLLLSALLLQAPTERPKMAVLEFTALGGVDRDVALALSQAATSEVSQRGFFTVISAADIQTMIGLERQKQLLGCNEDSSSCLSELAGALGARFVLSGQVSKLGETLQLALTTMDTVKGQPLGRSTRLAKDLSTLRDTVPYAVAEATATPAPPAPSRVLPIALITAGAVAMVAGGIVGQDALAAERATQIEFERGVALGTFQSYEQRAADVGLRKSVALGALAVGAAVTGLGIVLWQTSSPAGSVGVAFVPRDGQQIYVRGAF